MRSLNGTHIAWLIILALLGLSIYKFSSAFFGEHEYDDDRVYIDKDVILHKEGDQIRAYITNFDYVIIESEEGYYKCRRQNGFGLNPFTGCNDYSRCCEFIYWK